MKFLTKMLIIKWTDEILETELLERAGKRRWIMKPIAKLQTRFFGLVMREEKVEHLITSKKIIGKIPKGRQPIKFTDQLR